MVVVLLVIFLFNMCLILTFIQWSCSPLRWENGSVAGILTIVSTYHSKYYITMSYCCKLNFDLD